MGAKTGALATQLEGKARDAVATLEKLGDADWKKVTAAEKWTVAVTAHHLAGGLEAVSGIVTGIVAGAPPRDGFTTAVLDQMNAQHAKEHANCTKAETVALFQKGAATASAMLRGLSDDQLAKSGTVFSDAPPMTAEQLIMRGLLSHIDEHMGSIRKTVGM
jgi:Mycothiol maleylpyruvate isomerase N-terminal domain